MNQVGTLLASGSWDRTIRIWNIEDGKEVHNNKLGTGISALAWASKGEMLYSTDFSGSLISWDFTTMS
jgi:WD40 repeat protein